MRVEKECELRKREYIRSASKEGERRKGVRVEECE